MPGVPAYGNVPVVPGKLPLAMTPTREPAESRRSPVGGLRSLVYDPVAGNVTQSSSARFAGAVIRYCAVTVFAFAARV